MRDLAENHDWYIVPVLNVDGFVYTHEKVPMHSSILDTLLVKHIFCRIACGERPVNPPKFLVALEQTPIETTIRIGWRTRASSNPCAEDYGGPKPFSEPEIQAMSEFVISIKDKINVLLAFHSYSQLLLSPMDTLKRSFLPILMI